MGAGPRRNINRVIPSESTRLKVAWCEMPKQKGKENERRDGADMAISPPDRVEYERAMADVLEQMRQKQAQLVSSPTHRCSKLNVHCTRQLGA